MDKMDRKRTATCIYPGEFRKAQASIGAGACVEVMHHPDRPECDQVHVRNSRIQARVVSVPPERWRTLVKTAQKDGCVKLEKWFPKEEHGDFAATFFENEVRAFESGVLNNEPHIVGPNLA